ncbi:hypothetical protein PENTCL1PPCAC_11848 [Pristionchus entomophagus]|uniref:VHS domain-containing protein n=1 Tax=Pristionchus entomophagus TaxID=358040 RepID=A0AAV5T312_9BILA|nr:hypothetical protein PENTCL1PPCAC_11848 [Pristionchus entomophagus]
MPWFLDTWLSIDEAVEKATAESQASSSWEYIDCICQHIDKDPKHIKPTIASIHMRLRHYNSDVVSHSLSVIDFLWKNCGPAFRNELTSSAFLNDLEYKCRSTTTSVCKQTRLMVKNWIESKIMNEEGWFRVETLYRALHLEFDLEEYCSFDYFDFEKPTSSCNEFNLIGESTDCSDSCDEFEIESTDQEKETDSMIEEYNFTIEKLKEELNQTKWENEEGRRKFDDLEKKYKRALLQIGRGE